MDIEAWHNWNTLIDLLKDYVESELGSMHIPNARTKRRNREPRYPIHYLGTTDSRPPSTIANYPIFGAPYPYRDNLLHDENDC